MRIDKNECMACMMCIDECPVDAIDADMKNISSGYKGAIIDEELCTDCGSCVEVCPANAIKES